MDLELVYPVLLPLLKQWQISKFGSTGRTIFMTAEAISTNEVFKNPLAENPALVDII